MSAIHLCQSTLTDHIKGLKIEFSFLKQDVQKVRERTVAAKQCISILEDTVRTMETEAQITRKARFKHCKNGGCGGLYAQE